VEERKRGQRLFGALLGTLSQSSSSTAQKRRTDIERKQQAKLKQQADEEDEKKKQKREALLAIRRREQVKYDKQSVRLGQWSRNCEFCSAADMPTDAHTAFEHASSGALLTYHDGAETRSSIPSVALLKCS